MAVEVTKQVNFRRAGVTKVAQRNLDSDIRAALVRLTDDPITDADVRAADCG